MVKGLIKLCYRKLIDNNSTNNWDKYVFEDTHREFYMQAQQFDQKGQYTTFQELLLHIPKAEQIHYLVSTAALGYLRQLNGLIPELLNVWGQTCVPFKNFKFEILQSHIQQKEQHKVIIYFYSEILTWIDTIDKQILFAKDNQINTLDSGKEIETDLLPLIPNLNIISFQKNLI